MGFTDATTVRAEIDIPTGWMQDDEVSLATGSPERPANRRIDLFGSVIGTFPDPCRFQLGTRRSQRLGPG